MTPVICSLSPNFLNDFLGGKPSTPPEFFLCKKIGVHSYPIPSMGMGIFTYMNNLYGINVGKYTSPMDPVGMEDSFCDS